MTIPVAIVRITAVSYLNTLPFIYGIEQVAARVPSAQVLLSLAVPSECARAAANGATDIALVPAAAVPSIPGTLSPEIITDYCLGAEGAVDTVALLTDTPLEEVRTVYLDSHSRTSVELVKVLARELWQIDPAWIHAATIEEHLPLREGEAIVAIGDKVFGIQPNVRYKYDLALEWQRLTGLPFVFAVWVACSDSGKEFAATLNDALRDGVAHIGRSITDTVHRDRDYDYDTAYDYLTNRIKYDFDTLKRKALQLFWEKTITPG